jgi:hypothetical protein
MKIRGGTTMKEKENLSYTAPLTGVEELSQDMSIDSVHDALQKTWETETDHNEQKHCEQPEDK